jgi:hypothetical protein
VARIKTPVVPDVSPVVTPEVIDEELIKIIEDGPDAVVEIVLDEPEPRFTRPAVVLSDEPPVEEPAQVEAPRATPVAPEPAKPVAVPKAPKLAPQTLREMSRGAESIEGR